MIFNKSEFDKMKIKSLYSVVGIGSTYRYGTNVFEVEYILNYARNLFIFKIIVNF